MQYKNLHALIEGSSSSRSFFLSLPVELQLKLHEQNDYIHTALDLRIRSEQTASTLTLLNLQ